MDFFLKESNVKYNDIKISKNTRVISFENVNIIENNKHNRIYKKYVFINNKCRFIFVSKNSYRIISNKEIIIFITNVYEKSIKYIVYNMNLKKFSFDLISSVEDFVLKYSVYNGYIWHM